MTKLAVLFCFISRGLFLEEGRGGGNGGGRKGEGKRKEEICQY